MNEQKRVLPLNQRVDAIEKGLEELKSLLEEIKTRGNVIPEIPTDPETEELRLQIQANLSGKEKEELKKTLADLQTPVEGEVIN